MIRNNLYILKEIQWNETNYSATIELLPGSEIYKGHFPCHPITPGVCLVQIAVEIASSIEKKKMSLREAKDIKFLSIVNPLECKRLKYDMTKVDNDGKWVVCVYSDSLLCSKMSIKLCNA